MARFAQNMANLTDALGQQLIADCHVGPDAFDQLLLGHDEAGVLDQIAQNVEALSPQVGMTRGTVKAQPLKIEGEGLKAKRLVHYWPFAPFAALHV